MQRGSMQNRPMHGDDLMSLEEQRRLEAVEARRIVQLLGTLRGWEGLMVDTGMPCHACEQAGMVTYGGYTPRLRRRSDGTLWCHHHGPQDRPS